MENLKKIVNQKKSANKIRVERYRVLGGNTLDKEKYHKLVFKYGIKSTVANKMKFWSVERIRLYIYKNNIIPTDEYIASVKAVDLI